MLSATNLKNLYWKLLYNFEEVETLNARYSDKIAARSTSLKNFGPKTQLNSAKKRDFYDF